MNLNTFFKFFIITLFNLIFISGLVSPIFSNEEGDKLKELENKIKEYEEQINQAQSKQRTLASTISVLNNQINLTTAKIAKTNEEISTLEIQIRDLTDKITQLDNTLTDISGILQARIEQTYKRSFFPSVYFLFSQDKFSALFSTLKYLQAVQKHDKEVMFMMEETKQTFDVQKKLKKNKQEELEHLEAVLLSQNTLLEQQKWAKTDLLQTTKNDEVKFQQLLAQAKAEYEAIQAIIAGRGDEIEAGSVKAGERIATLIQGSSCNSSGTHLHFTVADNDGNTHNPFSYLKSVDHDNCSGPGECNSGDPFNPSGGWDWPISPKIRFVQGYGSTWAIANTWVGSIYNFHNGIDFTGTSNTVKAVADGVLYQGSYAGYRGCNLRYVRVDHNEGDIETFYLHVNY